MKKKLLLTIAIVTLLSGCGKTIPTLSNGEEAVVKFKDGSMISVDDLYKEVKNQFATSVIINMIDTKILEEEYSDKVDESKEYASNYIESMKLNYVDENGQYDESKLLNYINYYGYENIEDFQESIRINFLRNHGIEEYTKSTLKDKEIENYYKKEIVGDRDVYHIQIVPETKTSMTEDEKKTKEEEALNEAKAIIARLKKGEKFEDVAKEVSDDEATKEKGGSLGFINKGTNGSDEFDKEAFSLKVGEFSNTPVKTTNGYEIIYIKEEKEKKSLEDVKDSIKEKLAEDKLEADATLQVEAINELRKKYGVDIIDTELNNSFDRYNRNVMDAAIQQNEDKKKSQESTSN